MEFHDDFKGESYGEIRSKLCLFFDQYLGQSSTRAPEVSQDRGKGLLGTPSPGFPPKDNLVMSPIDGAHLSTHS